jgi:excisionase family DNA binding protein
METHEQAQVTTVDGALLDTIEETKRKLKLGRTKIYELINAGHLQAVKLGRSTRVVAASTQRFVNILIHEQD